VTGDVEAADVLIGRINLNSAARDGGSYNLGLIS
jgi:hypothetical protein